MKTRTINIWDGRRWGVAILALLFVGCQQQMASQPSYRPLESSSFFADGQSSRELVPGTVARGHLETDSHLYTGRIPGINEQLEKARTANPLPFGKNVAGDAAEAQRAEFVDTFPFPITSDVLQHGYHRYMIYCVVCHDPLGTGHGKIVERGYTRPPSYHVARLRNAPVGHFFAVISEGYGSMPSYAGQIPVRDRWAIAAYVRTLQISQHFPVEQLPPDLRQQFAKASGEKEAK